MSSLWEIQSEGVHCSLSSSQRRCKSLQEKGILYVGSGVSGGEDGARYGPSLMPGGAPAAWPHIQPIFQGICAKANGEPCCDWVSHTLYHAWIVLHTCLLFANHMCLYLSRVLIFYHVCLCRLGRTELDTM